MICLPSLFVFNTHASWWLNIYHTHISCKTVTHSWDSFAMPFAMSCKELVHSCFHRWYIFIKLWINLCHQSCKFPMHHHLYNVIYISKLINSWKIYCATFLLLGSSVVAAIKTASVASVGEVMLLSLSAVVSFCKHTSFLLSSYFVYIPRMSRTPILASLLRCQVRDRKGKKCIKW